MNFRFTLLALWFFRSVLASATPMLELSFRDSCTGEPVLFTNPNGTSLRVKTAGSPNDSDLHLTFHWRISGAAPSDELSFGFVLDGGSQEEVRVHDFAIPSGKVLRSMLERTPESRMLELRLEARTGTVFQEKSANVLVARPGFDFFVKDGAALCGYFTKASVRSSYYFNEGPAPMEVKRKFIRNSESGVGQQYFPVFYGGMGIDRYFNSSFEMEREWELLGNQGGVFAERVHFTRYPATRFQWDPRAKGACGAYVPVARGILDLGQSVMDFFTIPKSASGEPDRIEAFLNAFIPTGISCPAGPVPLVREFPAFPEFNFQPLAK